MKARQWRRLTWDMRIVYNTISKKYRLEIFDTAWVTLSHKDTMKEVIEVKHTLIKKRIEARGLFDKILN